MRNTLSNPEEFPLTESDDITAAFTSLGIYTWESACHFASSIPYGRLQGRTDFLGVIRENRGTCSLKHGLLKLLADRNGVDVELIIGVYRMNGDNTPGVRDVLDKYGLELLPEAHCYLQRDGKRMDFTSEDSDIVMLENDILEEVSVAPHQLGDFKVSYHKQFLQRWILGSKWTLDGIWDVREECISALSNR